MKFQLYVKAWDGDPGRDDELDDIFINRALDVGTKYTSITEYTGKNGIVKLRMQFRVKCQTNYYGENCTTFCSASDDDVNGRYTCNSDGSIRCREGFENANNNCRNYSEFV